MSKQLIRFAIILLFFMGIALALHLAVLHFKKLSLSIDLLTVTYLFNYILTIIFFGLLLFFHKRRSDQLGFIFMFSSFAKFLLFFAILNPILQSPEISKSFSFWAFFVPYSISLTIESVTLVRILKHA